MERILKSTSEFDWHQNDLSPVKSIIGPAGWIERQWIKLGISGIKSGLLWL